MFPINNVTGFGVTNHVVGSLEAFGLGQMHQLEYLSGCAMDGQYIHLNFSDHLQNVLLKEKDYHVTWDPAHRIELSIKDSTSDKGHSFIEKNK